MAVDDVVYNFAYGAFRVFFRYVDGCISGSLLIEIIKGARVHVLKPLQIDAGGIETIRSAGSYDVVRRAAMGF